MRKYKLLRFGKCYINKECNLAVCLLYGDKKHGYYFIGSAAQPNIFLGKFWLLSRVIPNDENWVEIDPGIFNVISAFHSVGHVIKFPAGGTGKELPLVFKKY